MTGLHSTWGRVHAWTLAACLGLGGCGRLIGIDDIVYAPDAGSESETDGPREGGSAPDVGGQSEAETGAPGSEGGSESDAESGVIDGPAACKPDAVAFDSHNCGRCGHDCLGGDCRGGT